MGRSINPNMQRPLAWLAFCILSMATCIKTQKYSVCPIWLCTVIKTLCQDSACQKRMVCREKCGESCFVSCSHMHPQRPEHGLHTPPYSISNKAQQWNVLDHVIFMPLYIYVLNTTELRNENASLLYSTLHLITVLTLRAGTTTNLKWNRNYFDHV